MCGGGQLPSVAEASPSSVVEASPPTLMLLPPQDVLSVSWQAPHPSCTDVPTAMPPPGVDGQWDKHRGISVLASDQILE